MYIDELGNNDSWMRSSCKIEFGQAHPGFAVAAVSTNHTTGVTHFEVLAEATRFKLLARRTPPHPQHSAPLPPSCRPSQVLRPLPVNMLSRTATKASRAFGAAKGAANNTAKVRPTQTTILGTSREGRKHERYGYEDTVNTTGTFED